jgi:hypothetical protein
MSINEFRLELYKSNVLFKYKKSHFKLWPTFKISFELNSFLNKLIVFYDESNVIKSIINTFLDDESWIIDTPSDSYLWLVALNSESNPTIFELNNTYYIRLKLSELSLSTNTTSVYLISNKSSFQNFLSFCLPIIY